MIILNKIFLLRRNVRDKVQVVLAQLEQDCNTFTISRSTGQFQGKMIVQPKLIIEKGKANRTTLQQATLEFDSIINKYCDKGYKKLESLSKKDFYEISEDEMLSIVPTISCDQSGNFKLMLAKRSEDCQNSVFERQLLASRKLNGVRMSVKYKDGKLITTSRGGKHYDSATQHLNNELLKIFKEYPDITLDGELYHHGMHLQTISGLARLKNWSPKCSALEFWVYDLAIQGVTFVNRLKILDEIRNNEKLNLSAIKIQEHFITESWNEIQKLHDLWVSEGFEGAVLRKPDKYYEFGKRTSTMIKVKKYKDDEFEIIDYKDGLRPEDFCFICQTKEGKPFSAKPTGDRKLKSWYLENIDKIIGEMGKVKYFEMSKENIPQQTIFQCIRYKEDIDE